MSNSLFDVAVRTTCYFFHLDCLTVYTRLLLDIHAIVSSVMSYRLYEVAVRSTCYFLPGMSYSLFVIVVRSICFVFIMNIHS